MFPTIHGIAAQVSAAAWYDGAYAAWQAIGAASLAASYLDLSGNGRNLSVGVAPTLGANGWTFNGINQYLKSGIDINESHTYLVCISNAGSSPANSYIFGVVETSPSIVQAVVRLTNATDSFAAWGATFDTVKVNNQNDTAVYGLNANDFYYNGVAQGAVFSSWAYTPTPVGGFFIGGRNFRGATNGALIAADVCAFGIWDSILDAETVATKSAQMAAL